MTLPLDQIIEGDCREVLRDLPERSVDLVFADPPYNLQLSRPLHRPDTSRVEAVDDAWDRFASFAEYDRFTREWLAACRRVLKPTGTIWVIGTYHNIFRVGALMQDLGFWILNDVVWIKTNPMPNFRGVRFTNAHETLVWASTGRGARYTFNHLAMKGLNDGKQMRSDWWLLATAVGHERLRDDDGRRLHSTQKPEDLLYRVILASTNPGDVVLDPFFGTGTTGVAARRLHRRWIGIERDPRYVAAARERIAAVEPAPFDPAAFNVRSPRRAAPRLAFSVLVEKGFVHPGTRLHFRRDADRTAVVKPDARLRTHDGFEGSIHQAARHLSGGSPCNGWDHWFVAEGDRLVCLDEYRQRARRALGLATG